MTKALKNGFSKRTNGGLIIQGVELSKLLNSLRTIMAYVMIFSLLWQNCLWAAGNFRLIDEDLEGCQPRIYGDQRLGIIGAVPLKNEAIHNVLEDLQLLEGSGVVFQGNPQAKAIYNRFYNDSPIQLSGAIETNTPCPMVFANPGGIDLENPDFIGIPHLTVAAGLMAQTDKGMAYGVDQGNVHLKRTVFEEGGDLKSLSLAGREIRIKKSLLSPSDSISLKAGHHIKGVEYVKDTVLEEGLFPVQDEHFSPRKKAIVLSKSSILRSKEISILSYEEGASIYANGLLQSTQEDIVIRSLGDVYIDKLVANRNLDIETTGRVFFRDEILVGGRVSVKASNISIDKKFSSVGRLFLEAFQHLTLKGDVKTEDHIDISGKDLTIEKKVSAQKGSLFNLDNFTNKGLLSVFGAGLQGTIQKVINEGKIDLSALSATFKDTLYRAGSVIRTRGHSILRGTKYRNEGTVFTCGVHQTTMENGHEDLGTFYSPTLFLLKAQTIKYFPTHKSYLKDGLIMASDEFIAKKGAGFYLNTDEDMYGLLLSSEGNLTYDGNIIQHSTSFPLMDYFSLFGEPLPHVQEFADEIASLPLGPWRDVKKNLGTGITLAGETLNCDHATIEEESGSISLMANGNIQSTKTKLRSGYFKGDNASLEAKNGFLEDTILESPAGTASIIVKRIAGLRRSHVWGALHAGVYGHDVTMERSSAKSKNGTVTVFAEDKTNLTDSHLKGRFDTIVPGRHVHSNGSSLKSEEALAGIYAQESANVNESHIEGKQTVINGGKKLVLTSSTLTGEYNQLTGSQIGAASVKITGDTHFNADERLEIKDLNADGNVLANGKMIALSGKKTAHSFSAEGDHIKHEGDTNIRDNLSLKAATVEQLGKTHAKNTHIEAFQSYVDSVDSFNEAKEILSLIADNNRGFNGRQKADIAIIKLKDMNLLKLLNQTKARITEAHLKETDVDIQEDVVVNTTLNLWARNLTNKAKFTVNGDFIAHIQQTIMNRGIIEGDSVSLEAQNIFAETPIKRIRVPGGYREVLQRQAAFIAHRKNLELKASNDLHARCVNFEAKVDVTLEAGGNLYLGYEQTSSDVRTGNGRNGSHTQTKTPHKSQVNAGRDVKGWSGNNTTLEGVDTWAGRRTHYKAEGEFRDIGVNGEFQSDNSRRSKGSFGRKSTKTTQKATSTFYANVYYAGLGGTLLESEGDNYVQAPTFKGMGGAAVRSNKGVAHVHEGRSVDFYDKQRTKKNLVWHSQQHKGHKHETLKTVEDYTKGGFSVFGAQGIKIDIKRLGSLAHSLDQLEKNPATAWVKNLRHNPSVNWQLLEEEHKKWNHKAQGLTAPAAAVIAIAIAIATQGAGAALVSAAATSLQGVMASAAFTSACTKATLSAMNNQGNLAKILKDLGSKESISSLLTSVATAGLNKGLGLPAQPQNFGEHLTKQATNFGLSGVSSVLQGQKPKEVLKNAALNIVVNTVAGMVANRLGNARFRGEIDAGTHKVLHGFLGAAMGAALKGKEGAISGAVAGITSELIAELSNRQVGRELAADLGRLGGVTAALFAELDVDIAHAVATNAVENNFLASKEFKGAAKKTQSNPEEEEETLSPSDASSKNMATKLGRNFAEKIGQPSTSMASLGDQLQRERVTRRPEGHAAIRAGDPLPASRSRASTVSGSPTHAKPTPQDYLFNHNARNAGLSPSQPKMPGAESRPSVTPTRSTSAKPSAKDSFLANRSAQQQKILETAVQRTQPTLPSNNAKAPTSRSFQKEGVAEKPVQTQKKSTPSSDASSKGMADKLFKRPTFAERMGAASQQEERGKTLAGQPAKQNEMPPPIPTWFRTTETYIKEGMNAAGEAMQPVIAPVVTPIMAEINEFQAAHQRVVKGALTSPPNIVPADLARAVVVQGLDPKLTQLKAVYKVNEFVSDTIDTTADVIRAGVQEGMYKATGDQLIAQWAADSAYVGFQGAALVTNPVKVPGVNAAGKVMKTVVGAAEKASTKILNVEQKVATHMLPKMSASVETNVASKVAIFEQKTGELSGGSSLVEGLNLGRLEGLKATEAQGLGVGRNAPRLPVISQPAKPPLTLGQGAPNAGKHLPPTPTAAPVNGNSIAATNILALKAPKMADHHIFPQQFKKFFEQRSINIDEFTVSVGETTHLKGLHGKGNAGFPGRWNQRWFTFIERNPNASSREIYQFGGKLMDEYKLNGLNLHGYKE